MRAPARIFGISLAIFIALTLILSRFQPEAVTSTINKFPWIKEAHKARSAAQQARLSYGSSTSSSTGCDADAKTCDEPYTSKDAKDSDVQYAEDQTSSDYDEKKIKSKDKDRRPSTKDDKKDADRGFTDAEQAAALERLELKYGEEAKDKANPDRVLWMETTSTTSTWGSERTEVMDKEVERARQKLVAEYGDEHPAATTTTATDADATETPKEKGWRTTGFETKAKTTQKTLVEGGGGNGTSTYTEFEESQTGTATTKRKGPTGAAQTSATATDEAGWDELKPTWLEADRWGEAKTTGKATGAKAKATKGSALDDEDDDDVASTSTSGRWDDGPEPSTAKGNAKAKATATNTAKTTSKSSKWADKADAEDDDVRQAKPTSSKGRWDDDAAPTTKKSKWDNDEEDVLPTTMATTTKKSKWDDF